MIDNNGGGGGDGDGGWLYHINRVSFTPTKVIFEIRLMAHKAYDRIAFLF